MQVGDKLGRYRLDARLGAGGMGTVYRAFDEQLQRTVALKVLTADPSASETGTKDANARLLREARAAARLNHPCACAVYDVGEVDAIPYIVMEFIAGSSLRAFVHDESVAWKRKIEWLGHVAAALEAAHEAGIVHRDVKPENVMIREDGQVKVVDFGIARRSNAVDPHGPTAGVSLETLTVKGQLIGTPMYMAPEQLLGEDMDGRTDQFAWGVMAYELLSGQLPWVRAQNMVTLVSSILQGSFTPLCELRPEIPQEISQVIGRALSRSPQARHASMADVIDALTSQTGAPPAPAPDLLTPPFSPLRRPNRRIPYVVAAAVGLGLLAIVGWRWAFLRSPAAPPVSSPAQAASSSLVYPCKNNDGGVSPDCTQGSRGWCDGNQRLLACCAKGLVPSGGEGLCACAPGGVPEEWDAGLSCRKSEMSQGQYGKLLHRLLLERMPDIRSCYRASLADGSVASGTVSVHFEIAPDGAIFSSRITHASIPDPAAQACFRRAIQTLILPPPPGGALFAQYPVTFRIE